MLRWMAGAAVCAAFGLSVSTARGAPHAQSLKAAAGSSPRPSECLEPSSGTRHDTLWQRARNPRLSRYCILLARGYAKLTSQPKGALTLAETARKTLSGRAAPLVLKARASLALGDARGAYAAFEKARKLDETLRLPPAALHDFALAAAETGQQKVALAAYRRLVPMAGLLTRSGHKERVYVEAALLVMMLEPSSVQEAAAYLLEARRANPLPSLKPFILAGLALALDRQGRREEARGVASEVRGLGALSRRVEGQEEGKLPSAGPGGLRIFGHELLAMVAMVATVQDRELSLDLWQRYLDQVGSDGPWAEHARAHLAKVGGRR